MSSTAGKQSQISPLVAALGAATTVLTVVVVVLLAQPPKVVSNFEQCKVAGGALLESYPEQCLLSGTTFTNDKQVVSNDGSDYVGMTEKEALAKAKQAATPARIVERDGEGLPVTMDFTFGRHNLYIKDGKVYKVVVEGYGEDTQSSQ